eukprot:29717-Prymnesium_polylepis.1
MCGTEHPAWIILSSAPAVRVVVDDATSSLCIVRSTAGCSALQDVGAVGNSPGRAGTGNATEDDLL